MRSVIYKTIKKYVSIVFSIIILVFLCKPIYGQIDAESLSEKAEDSIKIDSVLVNLPIIVTDKRNNFVKGLTAQDFTIYSDQRKQVISIFETSEDPLQVIIMLDISDSIKAYFKEIQKSAIDFVKTLRPQDRAMMVTFDCNINILSYFTSDTRLLMSLINNMPTQPGISGTCIYDSLYDISENYFKKFDRSRKVIILLTDGVDNNSKRSFSSLRNNLANSNIVIYGILYGGSTNIKKSQSLIDQLINVTGGRKYKAEDSTTKKIFKIITQELQNQYQIGFYPDNVDSDTLHNVKVEVARENVKIKTKESYYIKK